MPKLRFNRDNIERMIKDHAVAGKAQSTYTDDIVPGLLAVVGAKMVSFYVRLGNKRLLIGHWPQIGADTARHEAMNRKADYKKGIDVFAPPPDAAKTEVTLQSALNAYISHGTRKDRTNDLYRYETEKYLPDWLPKPLHEIDRLMIDMRFKSITKDYGWSVANRVMSLLRSIYKGPRVDDPTLRNPVEDWLAAGGKFHAKKRRGIDTPGGPIKNLGKLWKAIDGIENTVFRDALTLMLLTGLRRNEGERPLNPT